MKAYWTHNGGYDAILIPETGVMHTIGPVGDEGLVAFLGECGSFSDWTGDDHFDGEPEEVGRVVAVRDDVTGELEVADDRLLAERKEFLLRD